MNFRGENLHFWVSFLDFHNFWNFVPSEMHVTPCFLRKNVKKSLGGKNSKELQFPQKSANFG